MKSRPNPVGDAKAREARQEQQQVGHRRRGRRNNNSSGRPRTTTTTCMMTVLTCVLTFFAILVLVCLWILFYWHHAVLSPQPQAQFSLSSSSSLSLSTLRNEHPVVGVHVVASEECDRWIHNTNFWLTSPHRYGNIRDPRMASVQFIQDTILLDDDDDDDNDEDYADDMARFQLLQHSLCHSQSRLLNEHNNTAATIIDKRTIRLWLVRWTYLALHYHQHSWAIPEAKARVRCPSLSEDKYDVGPFDYQCPTAKYVVITLGGYGLGANMKGIALVGFHLALATNRVVLFLNNAHSNISSSYLQKNKKLKCPRDQWPDCTWPLVSCPRGDAQCLFLPVTPCVITRQQLEQAHVLTGRETNRILQQQQQQQQQQQHDLSPLAGYENNTVWIVRPSMPNMQLPIQAGIRLKQLIQQLSKKLPENRKVLLQAILDSIPTTTTIQKDKDYTLAMAPIEHAMVLYAMRPNLQRAQQLQQMIQDVVPPSLADTTTTNTPKTAKATTTPSRPRMIIGVPIRASDKCKTESECLSFVQYMQIVNEMVAAQNHNNNMTTMVIVTTESKAIQKEQEEYVAAQNQQQQQNQQPFEFVFNTRDVLPDSGFSGSFQKQQRQQKKNDNSDDDDADASLVGALSSLQLQLYAGITIGNCCSNFHILLKDFLAEQCGLLPWNEFHCLDEYPNPNHRICCGWNKACQEQKQLDLITWRNNNNHTKDSSTT